MRILLFCVYWLSPKVPCAGNAKKEEVFTQKANSKRGFGQYLCPFTLSLLFVTMARAREASLKHW